MSASASYLGFDFGMRYLGVAVGQRLTSTARPLQTLAMQEGKPDWDELGQLIESWKPAALIVGLPLSLDGGEQPITRSARHFAEQLRERFAREVHLCDERYTSREAAQRFAAARKSGSKRRHHAADLDAMAAAVILETWLNHSETP